MKHEVTSMNTKRTLAASLKKFMLKKPLSKITISEIIEDCGVNRKTFYYHFKDIYDLLKWMLEQEALEVVKQFDILVDYQQAILFVIEYIEKNAHILNCAYDSMGRDEMKRFLYTDFIYVIQTGVEGIEKELGISAAEDYKVFVCDFYTEALAGMIIDLIKSKAEIDKEKLLEYTSIILSTSLPEVMRNAPRAKKTDYEGKAGEV